VARDRDR